MKFNPTKLNFNIFFPVGLFQIETREVFFSLQCCPFSVAWSSFWVSQHLDNLQVSEKHTHFSFQHHLQLAPLEPYLVPYWGWLSHPQDNNSKFSKFLTDLKIIIISTFYIILCFFYFLTRFVLPIFLLAFYKVYLIML